mgnify:FL=1
MSQLCDDGDDYSFFFDRLLFNYRHGDAESEHTGEGVLGMSPGKKQICKGHAAPVRPEGIDRHSIIFNEVLYSKIAFHT